MIEHANIFYMPYLNVIGGTEQFVYEIAKKYYKYDIAVIYKTGHSNQLARLMKYVKLHKYKGGHIKCKKFFCFGHRIYKEYRVFLNNVVWKFYIIRY